MQNRYKNLWQLAVQTLVLVWTCLNLPMAQAKDAVVNAIRISEANGHTHFEVDLSKATGFTVDVLPNPYRVIIDVANLNFDLPPGIGQKGQGLISSFRYGVIEEGKSRMVLDVSGPVLIDGSQAIAAKGKKPAHIIVDISATTAEAFAATFSKDHPESAPQAEVATATPEVTSTSIKTVVIDPGHGGIDPGAMSPTKTLEKSVVLHYGNSLRTALESTGHYKVIMTRDSDVFVPLEKRVQIARDNNADLFIAIHADTVHGQQARGTTLYTLSDKASDAEAEALAAKENKSDVIAGIDLATESKDVANILINLTQRESRNRAVFFSKKAVNELKQVTAFTGQPMRSAAFVVLKAPDIPSVLIELGYLSSTEDEALLTSNQWQHNMAVAMAKAVDSFFAQSLAFNQK
jgi:N-acetylmuramoyl-L-alanine amidase